MSLTDTELKRCVRDFEATHCDAKRPHVHLNTQADQYTEGFKMMPNLTAQWRAYRENWERRLRGEPPRETRHISVTSPHIDEDSIEQAYWEYLDLHTRACRSTGPMQQRDAFKLVVRKLIGDHIKDLLPK